MQSVVTQHNSIQVEMHQALLGLHHSLTNFLCSYLTERRGIGAQETSGMQSKRINKLHWENPGERELKTASFILKQMKRALEEESRNGRETTTGELLMNVYRHIWTYLVLSRWKGTQRVLTARHFHDQEIKFEIKADCEIVVHFLQHPTLLLNQNSSSDGGNRFNQALTRILRYLQQLTGRGTRHLQTSYEEERQLKEVDSTLGITCAL